MPLTLIPSNPSKVISRSISFKKHLRSRMTEGKQQVEQDLASRSFKEIHNKQIKKKESAFPHEMARAPSFAPTSLVPTAFPPPAAPLRGLPAHLPLQHLPASLPLQPTAWLPARPQQPPNEMQHAMAMSLYSQIESQIQLLRAQQQRILVSSGMIPFFSDPFAGSQMMPPAIPFPQHMTGQPISAPPGGQAADPGPFPPSQNYNPFL